MTGSRFQDIEQLSQSRADGDGTCERSQRRLDTVRVTGFAAIVPGF
jgi:hypothetical protein